MSEEKTTSVETEVEAVEKNETASPDVGLVAESKKYRLRAQDAEGREEALKTKLANIENQQLKDKEDYKTLSEKQASELSDLSPYKEKYEAEMQLQKDKLLDKIPENKRDEFKDENVKTLRGIVSMLDENKPSEAPTARGSVGSQPPPADWTTLSPKDAKAGWADRLANATRKQKN